MVTKLFDQYGTIRYYNGENKLHREDGPAVEYPNIEKQWWINGILHRVDGPAVENYNGYKVYFIMGKRCSYEDWLTIKDFPLLW